MCEKILRGDLYFPGDRDVPPAAMIKPRDPSVVVAEDAKSLIRGLLERNPDKRLGSEGAAPLREHPFFRGIDWDALEACELEAPIRPRVVSETDVSNFDDTFTSEPAALTPPDLSELATTPVGEDGGTAASGGASSGAGAGAGAGAAAGAGGRGDDGPAALTVAEPTIRDSAEFRSFAFADRTHLPGMAVPPSAGASAAPQPGDHLGVSASDDKAIYGSIPPVGAIPGVTS